MTIPPEAQALHAALQALQHPPGTTHLPTLSRSVTRAADDLELVAEETSNRALRKSLLTQITHARNAVTAARRRAKKAALTVDRSLLFESSTDVVEKEETDAVRLAREINDSLRRTTAIVSEELDRSRAAGNVVEESTRRLRMTRDQHATYGQSLSSGGDTLKNIRRTEMLANVLIIASFALFFLAAAYVTKRRIENSNISTFVLRPGMKVVSIPVRILTWLVRAAGGGMDKRVTEGVAADGLSSAKLADEAVKAKEGRERMEGAAEDADVANDVGAEENGTCETSQECASTDVGGAKAPSLRAEMAVGKDLSEDGGEKSTSHESDDPPESTMPGAEVAESSSESGRVNDKMVGSHDVDVREAISPSGLLNDESTRTYEGEGQFAEEASDGETQGKHKGEDIEDMAGAGEDGKRTGDGSYDEDSTDSEP